MDNDLLKQLILRHRRIVIPEFGAFIKKESPNGEMLVFSPFLRKDDGMVTDAIVREYGLETDDARTMVAEFVAHLKQSLASGHYYIEGVGMLISDTNGTIVLKENEMPESEIVLTESIPEPEPIQPAPQPIPQIQQIVQPIQQTQQPAAQVSPVSPASPASQGFTRPQSIQVQVSSPPPIQSFPSKLQQHPQQQHTITPSQQRSSMPQGGYSGIQQPIRAQYQPPRSPVMAQQPQQQQPQQDIQQRSVSGQPMNGIHTTMQQQQIPEFPMGGVASNRRAYDPRQTGMPDEERMNNGTRQNIAGEQRPQRRQKPPQNRRKPPKQKTKADAWLIGAIIAAMIVIAIMIYAVLVVDNSGSMEELIQSTNFTVPTVIDTTTVDGL